MRQPGGGRRDSDWVESTVTSIPALDSRLNQPAAESSEEANSARVDARTREGLAAILNDRTLEILDHRRKPSITKHRGWLVRRALVIADVVGLTLAFFLAEFLVGGVDGPLDRVALRDEILLFLATLPGWIVVAGLLGLYRNDEERTDHSTADEALGVFQLITTGTWLFLFGAWLSGLATPSLAKIAIFWALAIAFVSLGRVTARSFCRDRLTYLQNTVIVGAGRVGQLIAHKFLQHPEYGINLVGFVDAAPRERRSDLEHLTLLGPPEHLPGIVRLLDVERVVIAFSNESDARTLDLMRSLKDLDVQIDIVPRMFEIFSGGAGVHTVEGLPLIGLPPLRLSRSARFAKRTMDLVLSIIGFVALAPLFAAVVVLIKRDSPGPVLFRQQRMGANDHPFWIYKFRTMVVDADERRNEMKRLKEYNPAGGDPRLFKLRDDPRMTKVGRSLRRYSLDELPQLINVVKGEMSLVGPRPLPLEEDRNVEDWGRRRLTLKPGITGLWQVLGRSDIPFAEMVNLDYLYVTNWSLFGDLKIILRTLPAVFRAHGAY